MKSRATILVLSVLFALNAFAQSADHFVLQGRGYLVARDITNANAAFGAAVDISPDHETANALYAITRLLCLPYQGPSQDLMDRMGLSLTNRDIYNWTARLPLDTNGIPIPPNGFDSMEGTAFVRTNILPQVQGSISNLAKIADTNFVLSLSSNETTLAQVVVDYGDIQMLRALLGAAELEGYTLQAYNLSIQLNALYNMFYRGRELTIEQILASYPLALTLATTNDFPAAQASLEDAIKSYLVASDFIRSRPTNVTRLFNYDPSMSTDEARFRQTLVELKGSLQAPVMLTQFTNGTTPLVANLGAYFSYPKPLRSFLPVFRDNAVVMGTLPDSTFGGVVWGIDTNQIYALLGQELLLLPRIRNVNRLPNSSLQLHVDALDQRRFSVQASQDLLIWMELTNAFASNGVITFRDPQSNTSTRRFYRLEDLDRFRSFSGQVVDAQTGFPVPAALIASSFDASTTTTDGTGYFFLQTRMAGAPIGFYTLNVSANGYQNQQIPGAYFGGAHLSSLTIQLHH
jgi:hypothetical protein